MAETETVVKYGDAVTWEPVRQLAQDISELYSRKRIFELKEEDPDDLGNTTISTKSTRFSDINARTCNISSAERGCVYLSRDITAPFRIDKLGVSEKPNEPDNFEKKVLAFEFAYDPKKYNDYLNGNAKPVLTTQYLLYYESIDNDVAYAQHVVYTTEHIARELSNSPADINNFDICTIANLIESDRSQIRKFWDYGNYYGNSYYESSTKIAGELYMLIEGSSNPNCCYIARIALAGLNNNGNGNSVGVDGKPAPWVKNDDGDGTGYVGSQEIPYKFVNRGESPWMSGKSYAVTLTGVSMDKTYKSNSKPSTNSTKGFRPETYGAADATYPPPPIGCSAEFIWPTIGTEGGGSNSFYSTGIFSSYIDWADWRDDYRNLLTPADLAYAKTNTKTPSPEDKYFPCYLGEGRTGDKPETYHYLSTEKSITTPYQRWAKVNDTTYVRLVPMEFTIEGQAEKAYLTVPVTVAKVLKPKSYQTAIRKRWYDMMYYTLRNIAGYKYKKYIDGIGDCYRVIGVTWNGLTTNNAIYTNPCLSDPNDPYNDDCLCTRCSYERWKVLNLGGDKSLADEDNAYVMPFVGTELEFQTYSNAGNNAAQMWTWEEDRRQVIDAYKTDMEDYDILFPELYFERLLCRKNKELYSHYDGGFVNPQKENKPCECLICYYTSYQTSPIDLPWEGGGSNTTCKSEEKESENSEITSYNTHAYTFKVLKDLTKFIYDYKLPEDKPIAINYLEIGYCYCPATMGDTMGITLMNRTVSHYACTDPYNEYCATETLNLKLPEIPAYYNTLSKNEKARLEPTGIECVLDITKDLKPFGYSAYIWKAVDIGGYKENRKDIKIEFVHYNPARVCSSGTIMSPTLLKTFPIGDDDDPLYMYDTNCYASVEETTVTRETHPCAPAEICPNNEGSIRSFNYNRANEEIWQEALYWSNEKRIIGCSKTPDPAGMASAKIWHRDNEYTSIGTIEIYVAPFFNPDSADHKYQAKFLGSCNLQRELPSSENNPITKTEAVKYEVASYACGDIPVSESMDSALQQVSVNSDKSFTADATEVIKFKVTQQPTDNKAKPDENFVQVDIIIPSELLIDESPDAETPGTHTYGIDLRQKYIILAVRASHTNINSGLVSSNGQVSNNTPDDVKKWATTYAGACRYAEFKTAYKFSLYSEETS